MHLKLTARRPAAVLATAVLWLMAASQAFAVDTLDPAVVDVTLPAGGSTTVDKTLHLDGLPAKADIIIAIDTTGSMGAALANAKADAVQICTDVQAAIPGARFAAVEFEDYPFSPYGVATDDPYELRTPGYTADCATFSAGVAAMLLGNGNDLPESNNRVHFEAYSDPALLTTRDLEASRFLVVLADNIPHSVASFGACVSTTPFSDPGRNNINESGAGDDLETPDVIAGLNADNTTLLYISYIGGSGTHPCHESLANATGGDAVSDESADDIAAFIIREAAEVPYTVDLAVGGQCPPVGLTFSPAFPQGPFTGEQTIFFTETITAPTVPGIYVCTVQAVMNPGGPTTAVEEIIVRVVPGPAATLELTPETDTNTAGDTHCVTATVRDQFGNPVPGVLVDFDVSGANTAAGASVTDASGEAEFCYVGTVAGTDDITATALGGTGPSDTATKTWVAGAPATLELTPPTATNTVDEEHCVTATVRDQFGNPTPGVTVDFTVDPPTFRTPPAGVSVTDANGQATFCYTSALPGEDEITATARGGTNPSDTATKTWVLPASTAGCKVNNGGRITAANGDMATFGGMAIADGLKGSEEYQDHGPATGINVKSTEILAVSCSADGTEASIFGTATVDGSGSFDFRIDVKDLSEPGSSDTYRIRLSNGYDSGEQVLNRGNVQIH